MPPDAPAVVPRPSASILVIRDAEGGGLEVLTVERSRGMRFAGGMLAFPGGAVDRADASPALRRCAVSPARAGKADLPYRLAALRELFEETGLLLAVRRPNGPPVGELRRIALARRFRLRVHAGRVAFAAAMDRAGLQLPVGRLVPFAHWVTPDLSPIRFDTRFYLAAAPPGQTVECDGVENRAVRWRRPSTVLEEWTAGARTLMFPTRLNLMKLSRAATVAEALAQTRRTPVISVEPQLLEDGRRRLVIPKEAGFGVTEATQEELDPVERSAIAAHLEALASHPWR